MRHLLSPTGSCRQRGAAAVEFAIGSMLFFTFVFGVIELARALYIYSTMIEVTGRAARLASQIDFKENGQLDAARQRAIFGDLAGGLPMRGNLVAENLSIDYLNGNLERVDPMPRCPAQNIINCNLNPEGSTCIRFVRVRLCANSGAAACNPVPYVPFIGANFFPGAPLSFPTFATVTPAGTLGFQPGVPGSCV